MIETCSHIKRQLAPENFTNISGKQSLLFASSVIDDSGIQCSKHNLHSLSQIQQVMARKIVMQTVTWIAKCKLNFNQQASFLNNWKHQPFISLQLPRNIHEFALAQTYKCEYMPKTWFKTSVSPYLPVFWLIPLLSSGKMPHHQGILRNRPPQTLYYLLLGHTCITKVIIGSIKNNKTDY